MAGTQNQPLEYEQLSYNSPDGAQFGKSSTEKIGFYGRVPATIPTITGSLSSAACASSLLYALTSLGLVIDGTAA